MMFTPQRIKQDLLSQNSFFSPARTFEEGELRVLTESSSKKPKKKMTIFNTRMNSHERTRNNKVVSYIPTESFE